jgi:peptide-methionine (S)-S-oxide reductase
VHTATSGYSGGLIRNPSYREVCTGKTGHAEVVQVAYDPEVVAYEDLLEVFWKTHDPTTLNRQGNDEGTQYRSVIFYHDELQRQLAEEFRQKLDSSGAFHGPIVTEIAPFDAFYPAEEYHQDYFRLNSNAPYCSYVIAPKVEKFEQVFGPKIKDSDQP